MPMIHERNSHGICFQENNIFVAGGLSNNEEDPFMN